ncbi:MAG: hypothetical protein QN183_00095 [Armatimonadota bacterium]|nr:hypothetical protein [Armatimonadota bacterium]MDR7484793.1 hypothetical protein [Armatimonadota bacterium]MDR7531908.1 hypothetical protein [Armatimonadota bacterium]MDR7534747.1 hypothetical protein [Armatimonadota bacterium]
MSSAALLIRRTLRYRPWRMAVLLGGFGLGVAVMVALLAVGDALLSQARDRDVVAGGDLVLLPAGLDPEVLKVGAVTGMYLAIPNARFLTRQVLLGPRYAAAIAGASPEIVDKLVYVRTDDGRVHTARASGVVPEAARDARSALAVDLEDPAAAVQGGPLLPPWPALLARLDRFHQPPVGTAGRAWAEWWYFNFAAADGAYGYVSMIADRARRVTVAVEWRRPGREPVRWIERHAGGVLPVEGTALVAGPHRVELRDGVYHVRLRRQGFAADLRWRPVPFAYVPPLELDTGAVRSGYVVPALRAAVTGRVIVGGAAVAVDAIGYHDHNWGTWQAVTWEWGIVSTPDVALLAGVVRHPSLPTREMLVSIYALGGARPGVLGVLRAPGPVRERWRDGPRVDGVRVRVPGRLFYRAVNPAGDWLEVQVAVQEVTATSLVAAGVAVAGADRGVLSPGREVFLQMRGRFAVRGIVGGRRLAVTAPGFAETFVSLKRR